MAEDLLAQFRRNPKQSGEDAAGKDSDEYVAFETKDRVHRLRIRCATAPVNAPGYNILLNIVYDGDKGTNFILVYTCLMVMVTGKNLQKLVYALENGMADYIQEFDPQRWKRPTSAEAPMIESIEVKIIESGEAHSGARH